METIVLLWLKLAVLQCCNALSLIIKPVFTIWAVIPLHFRYLPTAIINTSSYSHRFTNMIIFYSCYCFYACQCVICIGGLIPVLSALDCLIVPKAWVSRWGYLVTLHIGKCCSYLQHCCCGVESCRMCVYNPKMYHMGCHSWKAGRSCNLICQLNSNGSQLAWLESLNGLLYSSVKNQ